MMFKNKKQFIIFLLCLNSFSVYAANNSKKLEEINTVNKSNEEILKVTSTKNKFKEENYNRSNSIIPVSKGHLWSTAQFKDADKKLGVKMTTEPVVENNAFQSNTVSFKAETNYSHYITNYEFSIYTEDDKDLLDPIKVIQGVNLKNGEVITWTPGSMDELEENKVLKFKLRVYDGNKNFDETDLGVIQLITPETSARYKRENKKSDFYPEKSVEELKFGETSLKMSNIQTPSGTVFINGTNLLDIKEIKVGGDSFSVDKDNKIAIEKLYPVGEQTIEVTVVDKTGNVYSHKMQVNIPKDYSFVTGVADITIGKYSGGTDDGVISELNGKFFSKGRLAVNGEFRSDNNMSGKLQFDTKEQELTNIFKGMFNSETRNPYTRIKENYPLYGDNSSVSGVSNYGNKKPFYAEVKYKDSQAVFGGVSTNLNSTELSNYSKSIYGLKADLVATSSNNSGERNFRLSAFGAGAETSHATNKFLGTGGSVYYLNKEDVLKGSEKLKIEVIDPETGMAEKEIVLVEGKDYEINGYQGTIILTKPLSQYEIEENIDVLQQGTLDRKEVYLVVDYDYYPTVGEKVSNRTAGVSGDVWLGDYIQVGATAVNDKRTDDTYSLYGANLKLKYSAGTYVDVEYAKSSSRKFESAFISSNGGVNFDKTNEIELSGKGGKAYSIKGNVNLHDIDNKMFGASGNNLKFWHANVGENFSGGNYNQNHTLVTKGVELELTPSSSFSISSRYSDTIKKKYSSTDEIKTTVINVKAKYNISDAFSASSGIERNVEKTPSATKETVTLGVGANFKVNSDLSIYGSLQAAKTKGEDKNLMTSTVGMKSKLSDALSLNVEGRASNNKSYGTTTSVNYNLTKDYSVYLSHIWDKQDSENSNSFTLGQKANITDNFKIYSENTFSKSKGSINTLQSYGVNYDVNKDFHLGLKANSGKVSTYGKDYDRFSISASSNLSANSFKLNNVLEYRKDKGNDEKKSHVATLNNLSWAFTDSLNYMTKFDYIVSMDDNTGDVINRNTEFGFGFSYRPTNNNRANLLGRYTYINSKDINRKVDKEKSVFELEGTYKLTKKWTTGAKIAFQFEDENKVYNNQDIKFKNNYTMLGFRNEYEVMNSWDVMGEYRFLFDIGEAKNSMKHGALLGVYKHLGDNVKAGVGYNFTHFQDDFKDESKNANGWFFNVIGKF